MIQIYINGENITEKYGFFVVNRTISEPEPQLKMVSVPSRNGSIDMSEVASGTIKYNDRTIKLKLRTLKKYQDAQASDLANYCHGQKVRVTFSDDEGYYWLGRCSLDGLKLNGKAGDIGMTITCDPYKYNVTTTADDWLWNPFDFENDVINETSNMVVEGSLTYDVLGIEHFITPIVLSDSDMTLEVETKGGRFEFDITAGTNILYGMTYEGDATYTFTGNGVVTLDIRGGRL